ncbi:tudor domain-containing protein 7B isoform X1 [Strongylocentrotus purpuratus]|uniref:HTH OST-type domain-containing protein n=1 Tax=Strongylocentrotus purpuratus TaxID=7668 RepID=A0A7M7HI58_STRPU|nr:tudor domain-containing protein 7B isoform X1 [Strongylocentrotus purpuratus]
MADFIEKVLRSVLISSKGGVPLQKLNYEFKDLLGQEIPYREKGFKNVEAYLQTMPTVCQIRRDPSTGETVCMGVANEETKHLDRLVKKQKATKKKSKPARLPRYSGRSGTGNRRPPPRNSWPKPSYHSQQHQYPPKKFPSYPQGRGGPEPFNGPNQRNSGPHQRNSGPRNGPYHQRNDVPHQRNDVPHQRNDVPHQRNDAPHQRNDVPHQRNDVPHQRNDAPHQRNDVPNSRFDGPRGGPHQRTYPSGGGGESWSRKPQNFRNNPVPNPPKHQPKAVQHSSSYELPPRFRRQVNSVGSASDVYQEPSSYDVRSQPSSYDVRSKSDSDYPLTEERNNNQYSEDVTEDLPEQPPQQPPQPPPVDDKIVSWVNETLAEKTGGLWLSGLKKLYKEKFQSNMEDDLIHKLSRLSLWTAEEIGCQSDPILYPNLRLKDTTCKAPSDTDESHRVSASVVGNDQILYPSLKVEISQSPLTGKERRNVTNQPLQLTSRPPSVPDIVIPEDDGLWEVYVSYIISVMDFYCIIMGDDYANELCTMEDNMMEFYETDLPTLRLGDLPVVGSLYAAQVNDEWLRVKVIAVDEQEAGCFLVDHGDIESVPLEDLRVLGPAFYELAFQAIPCKLHGMDYKAASETATTRFCSIALGQSRLAQLISKESKRLSLTLYRDELNINYLCALGNVA